MCLTTPSLMAVLQLWVQHLAVFLSWVEERAKF